MERQRPKEKKSSRITAAIDLEPLLPQSSSRNESAMDSMGPQENLAEPTDNMRTGDSVSIAAAESFNITSTDPLGILAAIPIDDLSYMGPPNSSEPTDHINDVDPQEIIVNSLESISDKELLAILAEHPIDNIKIAKPQNSTSPQPYDDINGNGQQEVNASQSSDISNQESDGSIVGHLSDSIKDLGSQESMSSLQSDRPIERLLQSPENHRKNKSRTASRILNSNFGPSKSPLSLPFRGTRNIRKSRRRRAKKPVVTVMPTIREEPSGFFVPAPVRLRKHRMFDLKVHFSPVAMRSKNVDEIEVLSSENVKETRRSSDLKVHFNAVVDEIEVISSEVVEEVELPREWKKKVTRRSRIFCCWPKRSEETQEMYEKSEILGEKVPPEITENSTRISKGRKLWKRFKNLLLCRPGEPEEAFEFPMTLQPCHNWKLPCCDVDFTFLDARKIRMYMEHWLENYEWCQAAIGSENVPLELSPQDAARRIYTLNVQEGIVTKLRLLQPIGITNTRFDCYAIVIFQALMACPPFLFFVSRKSLVSPMDYAVKMLVSQYLSGFKYMTCRGLIETVFNPGMNHQEDAEHFYETFNNNYLENIAKVQANYSRMCSFCGHTFENTGIDNHFVLKWPRQCVSGTVTATEMIEKTQLNEYINDWTCLSCLHKGCFQTTRYEFGEILVTILNPIYYMHPSRWPANQRIQAREYRNTRVEFSQNVNFGSLTPTGDNAFFSLAAVIYYDEFSPNSGHYTVQTFRDGVSHVHDDQYCRRMEHGTGRLRGRPYFAVYYRESLRDLDNVLILGQQ